MSNPHPALVVDLDEKTGHYQVLINLRRMPANVSGLGRLFACLISFVARSVSDEIAVSGEVQALAAEDLIVGITGGTLLNLSLDSDNLGVSLGRIPDGVGDA